MNNIAKFFMNKISKPSDFEEVAQKIDARFEEKKLSNRIERDLLVEQLSLVREEWDTV